MTISVNRIKLVLLGIAVTGIILPFSAFASNLTAYRTGMLGQEAASLMVLVESVLAKQPTAENRPYAGYARLHSSLGDLYLGVYLRQTDAALLELGWPFTSVSETADESTLNTASMQAGLTFARDVAVDAPWADISLYIYGSETVQQAQMSGRINKRLSLMPEVCGICIDMTPATLSVGVDLAVVPRYNLRLHFNW